VLELSDWEFKTTMINVVRALLDKDSIKEHRNNVHQDGNHRGAQKC
jgi:hypothetical protein